MRLVLLVVCICTTYISFSQSKEDPGFVKFKMKTDSLSGLIDTNIQLLYKKEVFGMQEGYQFKGQIYLNIATDEIYKALYYEETEEDAALHRVFYYYKNNLVKILISDSIYYPFNGRILNSTGNITNENFADNILRFEKTCRELVLKL